MTQIVAVFTDEELGVHTLLAYTCENIQVSQQSILLRLVDIVVLLAFFLIQTEIVLLRLELCEDCREQLLESFVAELVLQQLSEVRDSLLFITIKRLFQVRLVRL